MKKVEVILGYIHKQDITIDKMSYVVLLRDGLGGYVPCRIIIGTDAELMERFLKWFDGEYGPTLKNVQSQAMFFAARAGYCALLGLKENGDG